MASTVSVVPAVQRVRRTNDIASSSVFGAIEAFEQPCLTRDFNYSKEIIDRQWQTTLLIDFCDLIGLIEKMMYVEMHEFVQTMV